MCKNMTHSAVNFAVEDYISTSLKFQKSAVFMSFLLMLILFPCWLLQALKDGSKIK